MPTALILLASGFEELEAVTTIDLLRRADINVISAGLKPGPVVASRGVVILPDSHLDTIFHQDFDILILPGGITGVQQLEADIRLPSLLYSQVNKGRYIAAICAAPRLLAKLGLLKNRRITAYPGIVEANTEIIITREAVVRDGLIITSRGPGTAINFALEIIELLLGNNKRWEVEQALQG